MKFNIGTGGNIITKLVFKNEEYNDEFLKYLLEKEIFSADLGQTYLNLESNGKGIIYLGMGEEEKLSLDKIRTSFFKLGKYATSNKVESLNFNLPILNNLCYFRTMSATIEGLLQSEYVFDKYLSEKKYIKTIKDVFITVNEGKEELLKDAIEETNIIMNGVNLARDLANERAIKLYPETLANIAKNELEATDVKVTVYNKKDIEDMNMHAFLAVSEGSDKEPKFIVMEYLNDPSSDEKIALVGKGLTYDSGGYSLKPSTSMDTMFTDMAGSATVIGTMKAIAQAKLKRNVVGIVAACENLVDGSAYKPGDIISSMSGKTIEVLNTDAEGRLTLADALWYAADVVKADKIIDLATLTGACIVAFSDINTGAITNNEDLLEDILDASELTGEPIWNLPTNEEYQDMIKSDYADLANVNTKGKGAGTITAGLFLEHFVKDVPWIHLDIAGTSYLTSNKKYLPQGATGVHVKTLFEFLK